MEVIALLFCFLQVSSATSSARKCYYPGGIYQPNDTPCNPSAPNSDCCAPEDICLSNGLCYRSNINRLHRGVRFPPPSRRLSSRRPRLTSKIKQSCTDPTFKTPNCTNTCTGPGDSPYGWADVLECPDLASWYCGVGNELRCQSGNSFKIADGYIADFRYQGGQGQQQSTGVGTMIVTVTETVGAGIASCLTGTGYGGGGTTAYPYPNTSGTGGAIPSTAGGGGVITAGGTPFPPYPTASIGTGVVVPPVGNSSVIPASGGGAGTPRPVAPGPSVQAFNPNSGAEGRRLWVVGSGGLAGVAAMMVWFNPLGWVGQGAPNNLIMRTQQLLGLRKPRRQEKVALVDEVAPKLQVVDPGNASGAVVDGDLNCNRPCDAIGNAAQLRF
ncbi:MAG: hypothetical protein Q9167_006582 [Letrouitia subvulpina]